jgi:hypothetical protein
LSPEWLLAARMNERDPGERRTSRLAPKTALV